MNFITLTLLNFFDYFYKKKILLELNRIFKNEIGVLFDVGAHKGETIIFLSRNFQLKEVFSFEPIDNNFIKLKNNTIGLGHKINYFNFALGEKKEVKHIKEMNESSSSTFNSINTNSKYFKRKNFLLNFSFIKKPYKEKKVFIERGKNIVLKYNLENIDLVKIDTEGFELFVIKGFEDKIKNVKVILFEHHYDQMIQKKYKFSQINSYLSYKGFKLEKKFKMPFRKTFEYIYTNKRY